MSFAHLEDVVDRSMLSLPIMHRRRYVTCVPGGYLSNGAIPIGATCGQRELVAFSL